MDFKRGDIAMLEKQMRKATRVTAEDTIKGVTSTTSFECTEHVRMLSGQS